MYIDDTMLNCSEKFHDGYRKDEAALKTIGDRIAHLLQEGGRADRGMHNEYEQQELAAWLSGEAIAPNGKKYNLSIDASGVNRLVRNKTKRPDLEVLYAICEIFNVDMEWLTRGNTIDHDDDKYDKFITSEAGVVARLVDHMDSENRRFMLSMVEHISKLDNEARLADVELAVIMARNIERLPESEQLKVRLLLSKMRQIGTNGGSPAM